MAETNFMKAPEVSVLPVQHPLEPLSAVEITVATQIARRQRHLGSSVRFISIELQEPPKEVVLAFKTGDPVLREAFIILLDPSEGKTFEAVVSISHGTITSWKQIDGVQPSITFTAVLEVERVVKAHPEFQAAMHRRGITDLDLVMLYCWPAGYYGAADAPTRTLGRPVVF